VPVATTSESINSPASSSSRSVSATPGLMIAPVPVQLPSKSRTFVSRTPVSWPQTTSISAGDGLGLADSDAEAEAEGERLAEGESEAEGLEDGDKLAEAEAEGEIEAEGEADSEKQ